MKVSVFIATSLDGFIARPDGAIDWLPGSGENDDEGGEGTGGQDTAEVEEHGWESFWGSVDCLILGRNSFEKVLEFSFWPYEGTRTIVLTSRQAYPVLEELEGKVELYGGDPEGLVARLAAEGHQRLYVDGGKTIQSFLREGLITDMTITTIPVLIGEGIPLFGPLEQDVRLKHLATESYASGLVQSQYGVITS
jgi:dihydrofolate reductase